MKADDTREPTENTNTGLNQPMRAAESVEGRGSIEGNAEEEAARRTQCRESGSTGLDRIREVAEHCKANAGRSCRRSRRNCDTGCMMSHPVLAAGFVG